MTGTLKNGFQFELPDTLKDDMEFVDMLAELDDSPFVISKILDRMLGKKQKKKLYEYVRGDDGIVKSSEIMAIVTEMLESSSDIKNL